MNQYLTLTIITDDRSGVVEKIAAVILSNQGSWLESNMSRLAGKFAGILLITIPKYNQSNLLKELQELDSHGINVVAEPTYINDQEVSEHYLLTLVGNDRPGIIDELSSILSRLKINVEELCTNCEDAPMSSELLFRASAVISIANQNNKLKVTSAIIQHELESLSDDLMIELEILEG